jgi:tryptophan synthase alpha chain
LSDGGRAGLAACWRRLRADGGTALIPYLTAGYPSRDASLAAVAMLVEERADIIEVGIPFSDPLADGPIIQRSSFEALRTGMTVRGVLDLVGDARPAVPVILFSYLNPILQYGTERFLDDALAVGCAGLLLTDLPVGGDPELEKVIAAGGLSRIPLVAVTTAPDRITATVQGGDGFVYVISRLGVTGSRTTVSDRLTETVRRVRGATELPIAVGFGVRTGGDAAQVALVADGVVVGSALVERLGHDPASARALMRELRQAVDAVAVPG